MKPYPFQAGDKYHHWELLREVPSDKHHRQAEARCSCGVVKIVNLASVRAGQSRSCGTCRRSMAGRKHGGWKTTEYVIWSKIKQRCHNPNDPNYFKYGKRGIAVCDRWRLSFVDFLSDVGLRPSLEYSLDRFPNNDGNYEPGNVRWATRREQAQNQRYDIWKRIVLMLAGDRDKEIMQMMADHAHDYEIARHIAATFHPSRDRIAP